MATSTGFTVWLTGMAGTGKSTLANYLAARLRQVGKNVEILDQGELADALWAGLDDTKEDRQAIIRRLGFVANLLSRNGVGVLVAAISPYKSGREENRRAIGRYLEVFVDCPTEKLISRDTTGKYKKALSGEIPNFIGITEPYEPPTNPEVTVHSDSDAVEEGARKVFQALLDLGYVTSEDLRVITGKRMKATPGSKRGGKGSRTAKPARAARVVQAKKTAAKRKAH